jgi:hypothetical protein
LSALARKDEKRDENPVVVMKSAFIAGQEALKLFRDFRDLSSSLHIDVRVHFLFICQVQ